MSFIFSQVNPSRIGEAAQPYSAADYYGAALDQGINDQAFQSIYRMSEYHLAQEEDPELNPTIPAKEANHSAQQAGLDLKFTLDPTLDEYNVLIDRKTKERDRQLILANGADGIMRQAGAVGVGFLGSVLNPLDFALNFVPVVGSAGKAASVAKAGTVGARIGGVLERGLITSETLASRGLAMRGYTAAIVEGTVGQAITEIPLMISNKQDQTKYTDADFALNVALGGAFGAGVHSLVKIGKSIHGRMKEAKLAHSRLTPETHENMAGSALEDFLEGQEIDPARISLLDDFSVERMAKIIDEANLEDPYATIIREADLSPLDHKPIYEKISAWSDWGSINPKLQGELLSLPPVRSDVPVYRSFENISDLEVGSMLTEQQKGFAGWSEGTTQTNDWARDFGGRLVLDGKEVILPHSVINQKFDEFGINKGEYFESDAESFIDPRKEYVVTAIDESDGIKNFYVESIGNPSSIESRTQAANDQLTAYKNHESQKATEKQKQLDQEIAGAKTLESPDDHLYTGDLAHIEKELAKLDDEIAELADELGFEAYGDFELDPRITGDVAALRRDISNEDLNKVVSFLEASKSQRQAILDKLPVRYSPEPVYLISEPTTIFSEVGDIISGKDLSPHATSATNGGQALAERSFAHLNTLLPDKDQIDLSAKTISEAKNYYTVITENAPIALSHVDAMQTAKISKIKLNRADTASKSDYLNSNQEYRVTKIESDKTKHVVYLEPILKADFADLKNYDAAIPLEIWKTFLPKLEADAPLKWKSEDVSYAAEQIVPELEPLFKQLYEIDPTLKEVTIEFSDKLFIEDGAAGMYRGSKDTIEISTTHATPDTVVHEMIHASAVLRMRKDIESVSTTRILTQEGPNYIRNLQRYAMATKNEGYKEIVDAYVKTLDYHARTTGDSGVIIHANKEWSDFQKNTAEPQYGLLNIDEFIAEGLSNKQFQKYLNSISAGKQTLFTKFMNALKSLFEIGPSKKSDGTNSVLDQLFSGFEKSINAAPNRTGMGLLDNLARAKIDDINKNVIAQASNCILL